MNANEVAKVYETLLEVPWMNDTVKVDLKVSRKEILVLCQAIKEGIIVENGMVKILLSPLPKESAGQISAIADDFLDKAGLSGLYGKLKGLK
jgi:hypothetical protein